MDGRLKLDQWTDKSGQKRSKHSLVVESMKMLGGREEEHFVPAGLPTEQKSEATSVKVEKPDVELSFSEENCPF